MRTPQRWFRGLALGAALSVLGFILGSAVHRAFFILLFPGFLLSWPLAPLGLLSSREEALIALVIGAPPVYATLFAVVARLSRLRSCSCRPGAIEPYELIVERLEPAEASVAGLLSYRCRRCGRLWVGVPPFDAAGPDRLQCEPSHTE